MPLSPEQAQLLDIIHAMTGMHSSLPAIALPEETPSTTRVFEQGRRQIRREGFPSEVVARRYGSSGDDWSRMHEAMYAAVAEAHAADHTAALKKPLEATG